MQIKALITSFTLLTLFSCQESKKPLEKFWLGKPIDFTQVQEVVNTYYMYDSTNTKVGSMIFGFSFENGRLIARDTSQFDNGSIYETAEFTFDTAQFQMNKVSIDMQTQRATLDIDIKREDEKLAGSYILHRDTTTTTFKIDSTYKFSAIRGEIYMLIHTLNLEIGDTVKMETLVPTSMSVSTGQLEYSGVEKINTSAGIKECDVIWLRADGIMPNNKIWISKSSPRTILKFYIPGPELTINLETRVKK